MDQTESSTRAAVTNSPVVKVNVTLLPILGKYLNNCQNAEWMNNFGFYLLFSSILDISGGVEGCNKWLCVMEPY